MRFVLTVLAILTCLAFILQHGDAKPLSRVESERELRVLSELITYLSKKEEDGKILPSPPQQENPSSEDSKPLEKGDLSLGGDISAPDNQEKEAQKSGENKNSNKDPNGKSMTGEQNNNNDNKNGPHEGGSEWHSSAIILESLNVNTEDKENDVTTVIEENLQKEFNEIEKNVDDLLTLIDNGLRNGDLNEILDILKFLQQFLRDLGYYNQNLQPYVMKTAEKLNGILSEMKNAAEQLRLLDEASSDISDNEEKETSAKEGKKPYEDVDGEGKQADGKENAAHNADGEEKQTNSADLEGTPADKASEEEKPAGIVSGEDKQADADSGEEKPAGNAGGGEKSPDNAGVEEKLPDNAGGEGKQGTSADGGGEQANSAAGGGSGGEEVDVDGRTSKRFQKKKTIQKKEQLLRILNNLKEL